MTVMAEQQTKIIAIRMVAARIGPGSRKGIPKLPTNQARAVPPTRMITAAIPRSNGIPYITTMMQY